MSDESAGKWIVEPPQPGEVSIHLAFGTGVELTPEQEAAVGELVRSLEAVDAEVTGYDMCKTLGSCQIACKPVRCVLRCPALRYDAQDAGTDWNLMGSFTLPT